MQEMTQSLKKKRLYNIRFDGTFLLRRKYNFLIYIIAWLKCFHHDNFAFPCIYAKLQRHPFDIFYLDYQFCKRSLRWHIPVSEKMQYVICIGNWTVSGGIWDKYRVWYFKVHQNITSRRGEFWNIKSQYLSQIPRKTVLFPVYTTCLLYTSPSPRDA